MNTTASTVHGPRRRGMVAVQVMIMLIVLLGCLAFAVDVGYIYDLRGSMQSGVDASSLAGASALPDGRGAAKNRVIEYGAKNFVDKESLKSEELRVTIGVWDGLAGTFIPLPETDERIPNAVRVIGRRNNIPLYLGGILGDNTTNVAKAATALQGGGHCLGVWGLEGITASGDIGTDSYDKRVSDYGGTNVRPNGDLCTCGDLSLGGNTAVRGDAMYGDGYNLELHGSSYEVWGQVDDQKCNLNPPTFDMAAAEEENDNDLIPLADDGEDPLSPTGGLFLTGNENVTLPPGKYYFTSFRVVSLATVTITGPTQIYVDGPLDIGGGGIINETGDPRDLVFYSTARTINYAGTSDFYGSIVAPNSDIDFLGDSVVYGVVVGRTLDFRGNTIIHVEESSVYDIFGLESVSPILVQ